MAMLVSQTENILPRGEVVTGKSFPPEKPFFSGKVNRAEREKLGIKFQPNHQFPV